MRAQVLMPRKCRICGKSLSTYNPEDICFCHQPMKKYDYLPITMCGGWVSNPIENQGFFPDPGDPGYNEIAFEKVLINPFFKEEE